MKEGKAVTQFSQAAEGGAWRTVRTIGRCVGGLRQNITYPAAPCLAVYAGQEASSGQALTVGTKDKADADAQKKTPLEGGQIKGKEG